MRKVLVIGVLFLLMFSLSRLQVRIETPFNPKSLATLGFILLAAYTAGEIASRLSLPRITGYIITGVLFGPYSLNGINLFSTAVVEDLQLVNGLAVGLIALTAGAEMKIPGLLAVSRSLTRIVLIKGFLILIVVMLTVFFARPLIPFLHTASVPLALSVGMIFGVLAMGTSPAATIAVINETGSRGRLSDLTLGVAVGKDVVMVVLLTIAISLATLFSTPDAHFDVHVLLKVAEELFLSVVAGSILGLIFILYIRFIHAEMWLFIVAIIFLSQVVAERFHLEALLMFITAGFVIQNLSRYGDKFIHPIENVSLPVYVVFFSIAGAGLNLEALRQVGLIALILAGVRIVAIYVGTRIAVTLAEEAPQIRKNAWLGFISQAGVVLGLAIIVERNLPGLGSDIKLVVLGTIGMNLMLGPVTLKYALGKAGETRDAREQSAAQEQADERPSLQAEAGPHEEPATPAEIVFPTVQFQSPELTYAAQEAGRRLRALQNALLDKTTEAQTTRWQNFLTRMQERYRQEMLSLLKQHGTLSQSEGETMIRLLRESRAGFSTWLQDETAALMNQDAAAQTSHAFTDFFRNTDLLCEESPESLLIEQSPERFEPQPDDPSFIRFGKLLKRLRRGAGRIFSSAIPKQHIPFRKLFRYHFVGSLPQQLPEAASLLGAQSLFALQEGRRLYAVIDERYENAINRIVEPESGEHSEGSSLSDLLLVPADDFTRVTTRLAQRGQQAQRKIEAVTAECFQEFLAHLEIAGTFELPPRRYRFARVHEPGRQARKTIRESLRRWRRYHIGIIGDFEKHIEIVRLTDRASRAVNETVIRVLDSIDASVIAGLQETRERCEQSAHSLKQVFATHELTNGLPRQVAQQQEELVSFIRHDSLRGLRQVRESRELNALIEVMLQKFSAMADEIPRDCRVLEEAALKAGLAAINGMPPEVRLKAVPLQELAHNYLEREIARDLADVNRQMFDQVDDSIQTLIEVSRIINFNFSTALTELEKEKAEAETQSVTTSPQELTLSGLEQAVARLDGSLEKLRAFRNQVHQQIISRVDVRLREMEKLTLSGAASQAASQMRRRRVLEDFSRWREQLWEWLRHGSQNLVSRYGWLAPEVVRDLRSTFTTRSLTTDAILELYDHARPDEAATRKLPFIYQKLYDLAPLESADFLIAREEEMQMIEAARQRWEQGMPCAVAVIGELGSGKTSLINAGAGEYLNGYPIYFRRLTKTLNTELHITRDLSAIPGLTFCRNFDQIRTRLAARTQRCVIVLEDAHQLYLRTPGGFDALRKLLLLIASTSHRVFWIVSIRKYAWRYLDKAINISDSFPFVVNTENLSGDQLSRIILARHKVSGFDLRFQPDEALARSRKYRRAAPEEQQQMLRETYFQELGRASSGNILAAIFYWLKSVQGVKGNELTINPPQNVRFDLLHELQMDKLLTLSLIIQHGNLSAVEHAQIFGTDLVTSQSVLTHLANLSLLMREAGESGEERFSVNKVVYIPLTRELREKNILPRNR